MNSPIIVHAIAPDYARVLHARTAATARFGLEPPVPETVRARRICRRRPIIESRGENVRLRRQEITDRFRRACHSFGPPSKSDIDWFCIHDSPISARLARFGRRATVRPRPLLRDILLATAVDMSKRRIHCKAAGPQSGTIAGLFIAPHRTDHARRTDHA